MVIYYTAAFVTIEREKSLEQLVSEARTAWARHNREIPTHVIIPPGFTDQAVVDGLKVTASEQTRSIIGVGIVVEMGLL